MFAKSCPFCDLSFQEDKIKDHIGIEPLGMTQQTEKADFIEQTKEEKYILDKDNSKIFETIQCI